MTRYWALVLLAALGACGNFPLGDTTVPSVASAPEVPGVGTLTTEWGCGRGFWVSNDSQTVALHVSYHGEGPPSPKATLPHPDWEAQLKQGADLHANWCDDVLEAGEPTPVEESSLRVVAGELRISGEIPEDSGGGGGTKLELEATDLVVELPDGGRVPFGSITITNPHWGLLAG